MNQRRQWIVDKAFLKFDIECKGVITPEALGEVFCTNNHPKVKTGEMSHDQVFTQFVSCFADASKSGIFISRKEWNDYWECVSDNVQIDDHFVLLMKTAWQLN